MTYRALAEKKSTEGLLFCLVWSLLCWIFLFWQITKNQRCMLWVYTWYICGTRYFLAYTCELFVVGRVSVVDKKSVSVNLLVAILRVFIFF